MIPHPNGRPVHEGSRRRCFSIVSAIVLLLASGGGHLLNAQQANPTLGPSYYAPVYETLGISMPPAFESRPGVTPRLDQLRREPCDHWAIGPLATLLDKAGYARESAKSLESFADRCGVSGELLEPAYGTLTRLGDRAGAVRIATKLIEDDRASTRWRFLRGTAYEQMKDYPRALNDYVATLQLWPELSNVHVNEFYRISRMYDALGRPCEAITPLETYISFEPAQRRSQQLGTMIKEYATKGSCWNIYAKGTDRMLMRENTVEVTINGAKGRFVVDTGATLVSVTPEFAERARLSAATDNLVPVKTVGGNMQMALAAAKHVRVGNTDAADVATLIAIGSKNAYGDHDGLLGMSFLARFNVTLADGYLEIRPKSLTQ